MVHGGYVTKDKTWGLWERSEIPHFDHPETLYITRWTIIQTPLFSIFVHRFTTEDPRPTLHDHTHSFTSIILRGGYIEHIGYWNMRRTSGPTRVVRRVNTKRAEDVHSITRLLRVPTWTLVFTGRRRRQWGYLEPGGRWVAHDEHVHDTECREAVERRRELLEAAS
jgi:hypothetical protein